MTISVKTLFSVCVFVIRLRATQRVEVEGAIAKNPDVANVSRKV